MNIFDELPAEDRALLIRLPVRVGFWLSQVDQTGGAMAERAERETINTIVTAYAQDYLKSEFVQRLMEQTVIQVEAWPNWMVHLERVPGECEKMVKVLDGKISPRDLVTFKRNLLDIGIAVAMAFCEAETVKEAHPVKRFFRILIGGFKTATPDESISIVEYKALKQMAEAMGLNSNILNSAA